MHGVNVYQHSSFASFIKKTTFQTKIQSETLKQVLYLETWEEGDGPRVLMKLRVINYLSSFYKTAQQLRQPLRNNNPSRSPNYSHRSSLVCAIKYIECYQILIELNRLLFETLSQ